METKLYVGNLSKSTTEDELNTLFAQAGKVSAVEGERAVLMLAETGSIEGEVRAPVVLLNGRLDGDVHAAERVELAANARVQGNVHYRVVEMNAGAQLTGRLVHADATGSVVPMHAPELVAVAR